MIGIVGCGRIGGGLALQAREKGIDVVAYDPTPRDELIDSGVIYARDPADLANQLPEPRIIFLYVKAGRTVDQTLEALAPHLRPTDLVVDGGNSYWRDSQKRATHWQSQFEFVDMGTSGGFSGARHGACFMAGGSAEAFERLRPILELLAVPGGSVHCGPTGAGHFVKLVHNGIEFGMMQAIGEGIHLLDAYPEDLPLEAVLSAWRNGSVIRSWLIELLHESIQERSLADVPAHIEDTGEVNWLVEDALKMEIPIPVISQSVMQLFASRDSDATWARAIAMMRHGFGGHPFGPDEDVRRSRGNSRA